MRRALLLTLPLSVALVAIMSNRGLLSPAEAQKTNPDEQLTEEFHQTYPLTGTGRVSIENINGGVRIAVWDQDSVKVDAVKKAYRRERLNEAKIEVNATGDTVRIKTRYPDEDQTFTDDWSKRHNNPASVEYSLTIPRKARLDSAELINGALDIEGAEGDIKASSINGRVTASGLKGEVKLSTINGNLEATFSQLDETKPISLNSINGGVTLIIPSDANAQLKASTIHGGIKNDFGLPVQHGDYVGHELYGQVGTGGARIRLGNVNGGISIKHSADGKSVSQATNLLTESENGEKEARRMNAEMRRRTAEAREQAREQIDVERITREAQREAESAIREAQREAERAQREVAREVRVKVREASREVRESMAREARSGAWGRVVDQESKSFVTNGPPNVNISTFDGPVTVLGWDKAEVSYTATKRGRDETMVKRIAVESSQQGATIQIVAKSEDDSGSAALEVHVPRNATIHVSSDDGALRIQSVTGEVVARTGDGSIEVVDGNGRLQANTNDGSIRVTNHKGEVDARTGDGSISLEGSFTAVAARTGDGSITLGVPADSNFVLETNAESISNEGLAVAEDFAPSARVKRWKVGRGGAVFTLNTGDGRVILRRQ